jgi:hypothetical protein
LARGITDTVPGLIMHKVHSICGRASHRDNLVCEPGNRLMRSVIVSHTLLSHFGQLLVRVTHNSGVTHTFSCDREYGSGQRRLYLLWIVTNLYSVVPQTIGNLGSVNTLTVGEPNIHQIKLETFLCSSSPAAPWPSAFLKPPHIQETSCDFPPSQLHAPLPCYLSAWPTSAPCISCCG